MQGAGRLSFGPHPERARPDAELLLSHLLRCSRTWMLANRGVDVGDENWEPYTELLDRRYRGEPIQYITGETEFYGLPFRVTPDVLIPRPETEHLVEKALKIAAQFEAPRIVDVGTGSGAIAVALATQLPRASVTAIDLSQAALALACKNAQGNGVGDRIRFLRDDLLAPVAGERFEMIVSNPPYVAEAGRDSLAVEVREYEPPTALFAGTDGLSMYRRLIPATHAALVPGGYLLMEIGYGQSGAVGELLSSAGFEAIEFVPDLQGIPRVATARRP